MRDKKCTIFKTNYFLISVGNTHPVNGKTYSNTTDDKIPQERKILFLVFQIFFKHFDARLKIFVALQNC